MGELLRRFTFDRNTLKATPAASAAAIRSRMQMAQSASQKEKVDSNVVGAARNFLGVLRVKDDGSYEVTRVGKTFLDMYEQDPGDAWRWLLTRSLWKYVVPNGTSAHVNAPAKSAGVKFNFFRTMVCLVSGLTMLPGERRVLYYDELLEFLDVDEHWGWSVEDQFAAILQARSSNWVELHERPLLLEDLEPMFGVPRDNLSTVLNKALRQTGLFELHPFNGSPVGIALSSALDPVLRARVRHVIDHEPSWP